MKKPKQPKAPNLPIQPTKIIKAYGGRIDIDNGMSLEELIGSLPNGINYCDVEFHIDHDYDHNTSEVYYYQSTTNKNYNKQMLRYQAELEKYNTVNNKYIEAKKVYDKENAAYLKWAKDDKKLREGKMKDEEIKRLEKRLAKLTGKK